MTDLAELVRTFLSDNGGELTDYLSELVLAESPSQSAEGQRAVFELLYRELEATDYLVRRIAGRLSTGQLYARPARRSRGRPCQLLLGHADTVWPIGTLFSMPVVRDGRVLTGPGVYDMKAGLAQIVFALRTIRALGLEPEVTPVVFITSDEELGSEDSRSRIELLARHMDRVLVPEPSEGERGKLKTARKGVGQFRISIEGKSAHAGIEPEAGASAILEMAHVIRKLHALNDFPRGISVTVGTVEGGTAVNVVPAHCRALVDIRALTLEDATQIESAVRDLTPETPGCRIRVEGGIERPPLERTRRNRDLWHLAQSIGRTIGLELEECLTGGGSDGNFTSAFAATLDGLGGVGGGAHAKHEFVYTDLLVERTILLTLLLLAPPVDSRR